MARIDIHPPTRHHAQKERREAKVPLGGARHSRWHLRRSHLSAHHEHGAHAVSTGGRDGFEGKYLL